MQIYRLSCPFGLIGFVHEVLFRIISPTGIVFLTNIKREISGSWYLIFYE